MESVLMNGGIVDTLLGQLELVHHSFILTSFADISPKLDLSIEGLRSQQFSVGVFIFMLIGVFVFGSIIYVIAFGKTGQKSSLKTGEKAMVAAIIFGTLVAVAMGAVQLLTGYLF